VIDALDCGIPNLEAPIFVKREFDGASIAGGILRICGETTSVVCHQCGFTKTDLRGARHVLEDFWLHYTFEHEGPIDVIDVEGLEQIDEAGICLELKIIVRTR
jgi:hypothetical protein